jgi:hypothetical protein
MRFSCPNAWVNFDEVPGNRVDDDGNGYVDDISGWNFSRGNNDPQTEDSAYSHANSQMMRAVAEGDNGYAGVGICQEDRHAVGYEHGEGYPGAGADHRIHPRRLRALWPWAVHHGHVGAVHLVHVHDVLGGQTELRRQHAPVSFNGGWVVADVPGEVQMMEGRHACSASAIREGERHAATPAEMSDHGVHPAPPQRGQPTHRPGMIRCLETPTRVRDTSVNR